MRADQTVKSGIRHIILTMTIEQAIASTIARSVGAASALGRGAYTGAVLGSRAVCRRLAGPGRRRSARPLTLSRTTAPGAVTLVAGQGVLTSSPALNLVTTTDLAAMYDQYKINWMEIRLIPGYDPGQSGVTNNADVWVIAACDPTGSLSAPSWGQLAEFDNHKVAPLVAGREFRYRFRPKCVNALAAGNVAVNASDWLFLTSAGVGVAHNQLGLVVLSASPSSTLTYTYVIEINFSVKEAR
jgi:hypothetical protein